MKDYSSKQTHHGKTAFRTSRAFIGKVVRQIPLHINRAWGLAKRFSGHFKRYFEGEHNR